MQVVTEQPIKKNNFFLKFPNLVPRVLRLFGQPMGARRDFGGLEFYLIFLIGCPVTACIVLPQKSCGTLESLLATNRWPKSLRTLGTTLHISGRLRYLMGGCL